MAAPKRLPHGLHHRAIAHWTRDTSMSGATSSAASVTFD